MRDPALLDPEIRAYLDAENAYAKAVMADTEPLQAKLFAEMKGRIKEDDAGVPAPDGTFAYYSRFVVGGQHPLYCRMPRQGGEEQILLDGNALAKPHAYFRIAGVTHSPDHKLVAYAVDNKGSEFYTVNVIEAATGALLESRIADSNGSLEWAADSRTLLYVWLDDEHRPRRVLRHAIGAETGDAIIHEQADPGYFLGLGATQDRRFLLLSVHDHETAEISLIDAADPLAAPRLVAPREPEHDYSVDHHEGRLIILTNSNGAEDYRIVEAPVDTPDREHWREIVPHKPGRLILDVVAYKDFLVRLEREDGLPRIVVRRFADGEEHAIAFDEEAYALGISAWLRVRHRRAALHLFVDDDAGASVRLRHGHAARESFARRRKFRAATTRRTTSRAASWRRRRTARRCRSRCSIARRPRSTARRRCSSTATAPTA